MEINKETIEMLYYSELLSIRDIATKLGCSESPIKKAMRDHKIKARSLKESNKLRCKQKPQSNPGRREMPKSHRFGEDSHSWKGGRSPTNNGYMRIRIDGKLVLEHRYIWEQNNCKIPKGYQVHHINGDKLDNRIENLQMLKNSEHQILHARLRDKYGRFKK